MRGWSERREGIKKLNSRLERAEAELAWQEAPFDARHPRSLVGESGAWIVERGWVDIFAQGVNGDGGVSQRRHLFRVEAGGWVLGLAGTAAQDEAAAGVRIIAVGGRDCHTLPRDGDSAAAFDAWLSHLAAAISDVALPWQTVTDLQDGEVTLTAGQTGRRRKGTVWLTVRSGKVGVLDGVVDLLPGQAPWPLAGEAVCQAVENAVLVLHTDDVPPALRRAGTERFHAAMLRRLGQKVARQAIEEDEATSRSGALSAGRASQLFTRLSDIVKGAPTAHALPDYSMEGPLVSACRLVARAGGAEIQCPKGQWSVDTGKRDSQFAAVAEIARHSNLRARRINLRAGWWRRDIGPILAWREGQPVALLPRGPGRYAMVEHGAQSRTVDSGVAVGLDSQAVMFHRTFTPTPTGAPDVRGLIGSIALGSDVLRLLGTGLGLGLLALVVPLVAFEVVDRAIPDADTSALVSCALALVLAAIASTSFQAAQNVAILRIEGKLDAALQGAVFDRLLRLPTAFYRCYSKGDLAERSLVIPVLRRQLSGRLLRGIANIAALGNVPALFFYNTPLAWIACSFLMVRASLIWWSCHRRLRVEGQAAELQSRSSGLLLQFFIGIGKLKVAGATGRALDAWSRLFAARKRLAFRSQHWANQQASADMGLSLAAGIAIFAAMPLPPMDGAATIALAPLTAFVTAYALASAALGNLGAVLGETVTAVPAWRRASPILAAVPEVHTEGENPGQLAGALQLTGVTFRYDGAAAPALDDVSFTAEAGKFTAIVGPSGAGKSTIFRLLLGFDMPDSGRIAVDGRSIDRLDLGALRRQIGVVMQMAEPMWGTIYETICGGSGLPMDQAWEAARLAEIAEDIKAMPMGMQTVLTGGLTPLSGGQRQRLLVARALIRKPRVLLLDEATSALDNKTQSAVARSLEAIASTRLVIAHRLSTVRNADHIVVLDQGRVTQAGTFDDLSRKPGLFSWLVQRQL